MKLFTQILGYVLTEVSEISEEQQGFQKNLSTIDAIFIVKQIAEKVLEFDKLAYLCFIDLTKAFVKVNFWM